VLRKLLKIRIEKTIKLFSLFYLFENYHVWSVRQSRSRFALRLRLHQNDAAHSGCGSATLKHHTQYIRNYLLIIFFETDNLKKKLNMSKVHSDRSQFVNAMFIEESYLIKLDTSEQSADSG
jgi:hypothetical protein